MDTFALVISALASVGALVLSFMNRNSIMQVHLLINSRLDQLLKSTADLAHASGVKEEQDRPKDKKKGLSE